MQDGIFEKLAKKVEDEPYAKLLQMRVVRLEKGYSIVEMDFTEEMENIFGMAHGGAIFSLIDEAFEIAGNSHGEMAVALNMNVTFISNAKKGTVLQAEAKEISLGPKTATYSIQVKDRDGKLIATCQALVYRKGKKIPFL